MAKDSKAAALAAVKAADVKGARTFAEADARLAKARQAYNEAMEDADE